MAEAVLPDRAVLGEFESAEALRRGALALRQAGWRMVEMYAPFDTDTVADGPPPRARSPLPAVALAGGAIGGVGAFLIEWWTNTRSYPLDVGARPRPAIPAYIPIAFESIVLAAALAVVLAWLIRLGLPRLWAPIDELEGFPRTTLDRFWLVCAPPTTWPAAQVEASLHTAGAVRVVPTGRGA
ncbi:MAG TPA: quinol:electron acceptor oxidoreductase subunit ActD [Gemmatimonadales bacterium]|nr:quinol:electron acceptor oxidoreductase subunit ActD [Gemmatimonadales bacterium]